MFSNQWGHFIHRYVLIWFIGVCDYFYLQSLTWWLNCTSDIHNQNHVEHLVGEKFQDIQVKTMIKKNHLIRKVPDKGLIKSSFLVTLIVNNVQYRVSNVQFSVDSNQDATENDSTEPGSGQGDRETMIRRVLEQTSEAICEIDGLLTTLKCSS